MIPRSTTLGCVLWALAAQAQAQQPEQASVPVVIDWFADMRARQDFATEDGLTRELVAAFLTAQFPLWRFSATSPPGAALVLRIELRPTDQVPMSAMTLDVALVSASGRTKPLGGRSELYPPGRFLVDWQRGGEDFAAAVALAIQHTLLAMQAQGLEDGLRQIPVATGLVRQLDGDRSVLPLPMAVCGRFAQSRFELTGQKQPPEGGALAVIADGVGLIPTEPMLIVKHSEYRDPPGADAGKPPDATLRRLLRDKLVAFYSVYLLELREREIPTETGLRTAEVEQ